ncbi:hypothetical protein GKO47_05730 [SAR202 cluster bacterium JH639]|nr:hypothetical protein [SAR202 cluster bacterium JH639]
MTLRHIRLALSAGGAQDDVGGGWLGCAAVMLVVGRLTSIFIGVTAFKNYSWDRW